MIVRDCTSTYQRLRDHQELVIASAVSEVDEICADLPPLRDAVLRLLNHDRSRENPLRLLAWPVAGAIAGDPDVALPVCVMSRLWWAGAETLDDVNDGAFESGEVGLSADEATIASTACIALLPQAIIARQEFPAAIEFDLTRELVNTSLRSANGQLVDVSAFVPDFSRAQVMKSYAGKSGASYARDVTMTARMLDVGTEILRGWRAFGQMYGVLQQLVNDRASLTSNEGGDLANGTRTLLFAHSWENEDPSNRDILRSLQRRSRSDMDARSELYDRLTNPTLIAAYNRRIAVNGYRLSTLLASLVEQSEYCDLVSWMITTITEKAQIPQLSVGSGKV